MTRDEQELLMRYLDGEMTREEARAFDKRLASDPELAQTRDALAQVRAVIAARYDAAAEEAAPELDRLWSKIEAGMDSSPAATPGFFTRLVDGVSAWFEQYRGHIAVGAACGAAGVVLALTLVDAPSGQKVVYLGPAIDEVAVMGAGVVGGSASLLANATPAEIESLEVEDGSGTILRMPTGDGTPPTTIIWITRDEESPI